MNTNKTEGEKMTQELKVKLETIVKLVDDLMVDPDIEIEYYIPEVVTTVSGSNTSTVPYISVKYAEDKYVERKIRLTDKYLRSTPEEIAKLVTFSIEQFKGEIDSVQMG